MVLLHQRFVGMAFGAQEGDAVAEAIGRGIGDIVNAMTINTSRNIWIAIFQRRAMNACSIRVIDRAMAFGTSLRNGSPCFL